MKVSTFWHEELIADETLEVYRKLALLHCDRISNPDIRDPLRRAVKRRQWERVCSFELPLNDTKVSAKDLIEARQVQAFFQKLESLDVGIDKEAVAWEKFLESERLCRSTNEFFLQLTNLDGQRGSYSLTPKLAKAIYAAREKIRRVLGDSPPPFAEMVGRFGPGATTTVKKVEACPTNKMSAGLGCGSRMLYSPVLGSILREIPHWTAEFATKYSVDEEGFLVEWVELALEAARLAFVPKNYKTHRSTVTEPTLNGFAQLGVGDWISNRLLKFGLDLKDQGKNRRLAWEGSVYNLLATIDLSMASDTIARELVKFLLPRKWYVLLDSLRSGEVVYKDRGGVTHTVVLEKFSSMGNGFTFPLESLIFWALASVIKPEGVCSVFGDDIIVDSDVYADVISVFHACGFKVNTEKSFSDGPFRESCGRDYWSGIDIRPCYMKRDASARSLYRLHNFYVSQMDPEMAQAVLKFIPRVGRLWGPDKYGDGHLHDPNYRESRVLTDRDLKLVRKGYSGYIFSTYRLTPKPSLARRFSGDHITPLYVFTNGHKPEDEYFLMDREPHPDLREYRRAEVGERDETYRDGSFYRQGGRLSVNHHRFRGASEAKSRREAYWKKVLDDCSEARPESRKDAGGVYPLWSTPGWSGSEEMSIYTMG